MEDRCMVNVLKSNKWATEEDLDGLAESEIKELLIDTLEKSLNKDVHTRSDLSLRLLQPFIHHFLRKTIYKGVSPIRKEGYVD